MIALSVNVNKIATLRNSRGGTEPSVLQAVEICLAAGAPGITVHPRADERHIRRQDVIDIAALLARYPVDDGHRIEFNMEGDPRESFLELVRDVRPAQCTLVPVAPGEITSQAGWPATTSASVLGGVVAGLRKAGVRVSLFIDPVPESVRWAASLGADRVELYTEPFAKAYEAGPAEGRASFARYADVAMLAHDLGLGVNAGHDLDLENLQLFRTLPYLDEVSIGHALITHALWVGLEQAVTDYLEAVRG
jgi:pyridoxine 5-phosphate synthase